jgi:hypothetical protein
MLPELIIIDNFLNKEEITKLNANEDFWVSGYRWHDINAEVKDLRHRLIEAIYRDNWMPQITGIQLAGFEHWTGVYDENSELSDIVGVDGEQFALGPHRDKDEDYWESHPKGRYGGNYPESIKTPILGTVLYTKAPEKGGYLKIWDGEWGDPKTPYELIKPKENRLVIFNASAHHAVTPVEKGERRAVAINLWGEKPMTFRHGFYEPKGEEKRKILKHGQIRGWKYG